VVIVAESQNRFVSVEVEIGLETGGRTEIRKGLEAGQKVVVSSQFLIDSEANLKGTTTRMSEMPPALNTGKAGVGIHHGEGKIERIGKDEVTLSHGPIPSLQWGAMTMSFKLPPTGLPKNVSVGDTVAFEIRQSKDGMYEITSISPLTPASAQSRKDGNTDEAKGPKK
jgi:Cu(I)/Ag(I) efflux system membrane fusion protein